MTVENHPKDPSASEVIAPTVEESIPAGEAAPFEEHTLAVMNNEGTEVSRHTLTGSVGAVAYGSVQAWYVRAVEGAPRLSARGESRVRERLRRAQYDMALALGLCPRAVELLEQGFLARRGSVARGYIVRWPTSETGPEPTAEIARRLQEARRSAEEAARTSVEDGRDTVIERCVAILFELRPSDEAIRAVLRELECTQDAASRQDGGNIRAAFEELQEVRKQILDPHLRIVLRELRKHSHSGMEKRELLQEGNLGLLKAAELYDESREVPFSAYALTWVRSRMKRAIVRRLSPLHIPERFRREVVELHRVACEFAAQEGREPTIDEMAERTGFEPERVRRILVRNALSSAFQSLQAKAGGGEAGLGLEERLPDVGAELATELLEQRQLLGWLEGALDALEERTRRVLELRFGLGGVAIHTLNEAGQALGISGERVRQIEAKALGDLAKDLEE